MNEDKDSAARELEISRESDMERLRRIAESRYQDAVDGFRAAEARLGSALYPVCGDLKGEAKRVMDALDRANEFRAGVKEALWNMFGRYDDEGVIGFEHPGVIDRGGDSRRRRGGSMEDSILALSLLTRRPFWRISEMIPDRAEDGAGFYGHDFHERVLPQLGVIPIDLGGERPTFSEAHRRWGDIIVAWEDEYLHRMGVSAIIGGALRGSFDERFYRSWGEDGSPLAEKRANRVYALCRDQRSRLLVVDFVHDDGGREAAGFRGKAAGDCATRACAIILGLPYRHVYKKMAEINAAVCSPGAKRRSPSKGVAVGAAKCVFASLGLIEVEPPDGRMMTLTEAYNEFGDLLAITNGGEHITAVLEGAARDVWDPRFELTAKRKQTLAEAIFVPRGRLL